MVKAFFMFKLLIQTSLLLVITGCATQSAIDFGERSAYQEPDFQWPVYGAVLTQKFRPKKKVPYRRRHQGIDLAAHRNTPIYAIDHGVVTYLGSRKRGYGRLIVLTHMNGKYKSYYAHLNRYKVKLGDVVKKGDMIGLMGNTGRSTGVHLHFEIRRNKVALNPLDFLPPTSISSKTASPNP